jgi:ribonuclease M5
VEEMQEVLVVEGKRDTQAIRRTLLAHTIETGGAAIGEEVLQRIAFAQQVRGVIILTDPDHAGERIRRIVSTRVSGCKHAFLAQEDATNGVKVGVEHASPAMIRKALQDVHTPCQTYTTDVTIDTLVQLKLSGTPGATIRRMGVGSILRIGYGNAKTFMERCRMFGIQRAHIEQAIERLGEREQRHA